MAIILSTVTLVCVTATQTPVIGVQAREHLAEIISILRNEWLHREKFDWVLFERRVLDEAGAAQTIPDTYDAIRLALTLLADKHSHYITADSKPVFNPLSPSQSTGECTPQASPVDGDLPNDIGYVRIHIPGAVAESIKDDIRRRDRPDLAGWIVDMRNSRGGNMWPVLAGIGSLLGNGITGYFVGAANTATPWGYTDGKAWLDVDTLAEIPTPHRLARPEPKIALLTDIGVVSSGEAIAIAFRGRPNTRSFGMPTCGLTTAVNQFPLSNGGRIGVVTSVMADRHRNRYGGKLEPDEVITDPERVIPRAVSWLRQRN